MKRFLCLFALLVFCVACGSESSDGGSGGENPGVVDPGGGTSVEAEELTQEKVKALVYAAYAGIGYMGRDDVTDDEMLYGIMFDDLKELGACLMYRAYEADFNSDPENWDKDAPLFSTQGIINAILKGLGLPVCKGTICMFSPQTFVFTDDASGLRVEMATDMSLGYSQVTGGLVMDGPCKAETLAWFGAGEYGDEYFPGIFYFRGDHDGTLPDFACVLDGELHDDGNGGVLADFDVAINAAPTLRAAYTRQDGPLVAIYGDWRIDYHVDGDKKVNLYLVPGDDILESLGVELKDEDTPDHRLYMVNGSFAVAGRTYGFRDMTYGQYQYEILGKTTWLACAGDLRVPGVEDWVAVTTPKSDLLDIDDISAWINLFTDLENVISRDDDENDLPDGIWTGGEMTLGNKGGSLTATFDAGPLTGTLSIKDETVEDWQNSLDPFVEGL